MSQRIDRQAVARDIEKVLAKEPGLGLIATARKLGLTKGSRAYVEAWRMVKNRNVDKDIEIPITFEDDEPKVAKPVGAPATKAHEDPVTRRDRLDETARLRSQVDDLVYKLKEANARTKFVEESRGSLAEQARIVSRYQGSAREMTAIVLASDWHVEEEVRAESVAGRNEYSLDIAERRIQKFVRAIVWNVEHHRASGKIELRDLVLWLGGDLYSGFIHDELKEINALSPVLAVRWLIPRLRDVILTLLTTLKLERLIIPCSHGNHGRTTKKSQIATGYANSFDWLMYHSLADEFRPDARVTFVITSSAHQYVDVYGQTIHFHHGDQVKYMGGIGGLGIPLLKAVPMWDRVKPAVVHCIGHHHTLRDFGRAITNGSLIGYNAYAESIRAEYEEPQQAMFYIDAERQGHHMLTKLWVDKER